jgi:hypothetical protein
VSKKFRLSAKIFEIESEKNFSLGAKNFKLSQIKKPKPALAAQD